MGIEALYRRPRITTPEPGHKIHPYLLRGIEITRPNQVWAMDITYIPMARGFVYLAVVLDWFSRRVLSWRLSITMDVSFCIAALEDALARHDKPEIFNTDQGSQFTSAAFTSVLADRGITISMDGKGAWRGNVFVERLWRSVKYEEVYLRAYESVNEARSSIGRYLDLYNSVTAQDAALRLCACQAMRREFTRTFGSWAMAWMTYQPCFLAVAMNERMVAKSVAPAMQRKPAGDFLLDLHHAGVAFGLIVGEGHGQMTGSLTRAVAAPSDRGPASGRPRSDSTCQR
jgi:transposase InsO family protein